ncbi:MAG: calcium-binding protein [Methylovulum sp.]|nr:calcium-binding protein [Methylovulum sp.]
MAKVIIKGTVDADLFLNEGENRSDVNGYEILGLAGDDLIVGSAFDDVLDGGEGLDGVSYVDETADIMVDLAAGTASGSSIGNDTIMNIEIVDSGSGNDTLIGNDAGNILRGMDGYDVITGGLGGDILEGGAGNDDLKGGGGDIGDILYGNDGNDYLTGSLGNDYLNGGQGVDVLNGGDSGEDDIASYADDSFSVNVNLVAGKTFGKSAGKDILINIDSVDGSDQGDALTGNNQANTLQGFGGNDLIKGLAGDDRLWGYDGNDKIIGGSGDDELNGGAGNDGLTGGVGNDNFLFDTAFADAGIDKIIDFKPINDTIQLDSAIFTQLTPGALDAGNFVSAADAVEGDDYLIYDKASGALSYDADGNGADAAVQIAALGTRPALTFADFMVM